MVSIDDRRTACDQPAATQPDACVAMAPPARTDPFPPPDAPTPARPRRGWTARAAQVAVRLSALLVALTLAYGGGVVVAYDVSREEALLRARGPRLEVRPDHRLRPFDAAYEQSLWITLDAAPPVLVAAILQREDRRFHDHPGVDPHGVGRAALGLIARGAPDGGGSTISQQLAKLLFVGRDRSARRKIEELFVALWLDAIFSKNELLELYLNVAYFGGNVRGVEAAARRHFGLSFVSQRSDRTRFDAVMAAQLALALPQPSRFDPRSAADAPRIAALLAQMRAAGVDVEGAPTDAAGVRRAIRARKPAAPAALPAETAHRDRSVAEIARRAPDPRATYEAAPFLRTDHQLHLERAFARLRVDVGLQRAYPNALGYVIDLQSGGVTAQVGHAESLYAGSLTKPLILLCAYLQGLRPGAMVLDAPYGDPPQIANRGRDYAGRITLQAALARSVNSVFARLLDDHGADCLHRAAGAVGAPMWLAAGGAQGRLGRRTMALGAAPVVTAQMLDFYLAVASCGARSAHGHIAALWRPGDWRAGWRAGAGAAGPQADAAGALAALQAAMAAATRPGGTAHALGAQFRGPVAAKTGTDDHGRQFGMVAFTGRWLVYLGFWTDGHRQIRASRSGGSLAPAMAHLLVNLHLDTPRAALSCAAQPGSARPLSAQRVAAR